MEVKVDYLIPADAVTDLNAKLDALTAQVAILTEEAQLQRQQRQQWADLQADLTPVAMEAFGLAATQLEDIEAQVQLEDLLRLFKKLLSSAPRLESLLEQIDSAADMGRDMAPLANEAFVTVMERLDLMERKGYFTFAREGLSILDQVTESFTEEDVRQLGDNIVLILQTVKEMTQPEVMHLLQNTVVAVREDEVVDTSLFGLVRQLNDPSVKRGLSKTLNILRSVSDDPVSGA